MDNIFYEAIKGFENIKANDTDYSAKRNPDYKRQDTIDLIHRNMNEINWESESQYHNTYYLGKGKYGYRTLKAKK